MPMIDRIDTAAAPTERVVVVPDNALLLFRKAGLQPPTVGQFDLVDLDAKLAASSLTVSERFEAKTHLRAVGLLPIGRPVSTR
jgi:hypothetical protein